MIVLWYTERGDTMTSWERWNLDFDNRAPIYRQIILQFYRAFVRGEIPLGARVLSIREMSAVLKVNTNTMQRVYQEMEREGLITSKRGTGYFFTEDDNMREKTLYTLAHESLRRFVEEMRGLGRKNEDIVADLIAYMKEGESRGAYA